MLKRILKDSSGMALGVVLAIMVVVAILATGMFTFSYNELNFSQMDIDHVRADYLARSGVEIVSKAFPSVSGNFTDLEKNPVSATLYLHEEGETAKISDLEPGNIGQVTVTIRQEKRTINAGSTKSETTVWAYDAKASVGKSGANAKGFSMPVAYANAAPADKADGQVTYLKWLDANGKIPGAAKYHQETSSSTGGIISEILGTNKIDIYSAVYNGVVTVNDSVPASISITPPKANPNCAYVWSAPAVVFEVPLDLRNARSVLAMVVNSSTVIFEKEVHIYANQSERYVGNLVLQPMGGKGQVYFNDNVYLHIGSSTRYLLFPAGSVYDYTEAVDLFSWAVEHKKVSTGLSGWIRELFNGEVKTGSLTKPAKPPLEQPTVNSLTRVIWE